MKKKYDDDLIFAVRDDKKNMTLREISEKYDLSKSQVTYIIYNPDCKLTEDKPVPVDYVVEDVAFEDQEEFEKDESSIVRGFKKAFKGMFDK